MVALEAALGALMVVLEDMVVMVVLVALVALVVVEAYQALVVIRVARDHLDIVVAVDIGEVPEALVVVAYFLAPIQIQKLYGKLAKSIRKVVNINKECAADLYKKTILHT